jgi:hypothetical protein
MEYFTNVKTIEELKKEYKRLAFIYHPDMKTGNVEQMKIINNLYDYLLTTLKDTAKVEYKEYEYAADFKNIIEKLIKCEGLKMEICGSWLWVTGNTKPFVTIFKELGFKWRSKKLAWSLGDKSKIHHAELSMDKIRGLYGSQVITSNDNNKKPTLE